VRYACLCFIKKSPFHGSPEIGDFFTALKKKKAGAHAVSSVTPAFVGSSYTAIPARRCELTFARLSFVGGICPV